MRRDNLSLEPIGSYVYAAVYDGEVVYIGLGKGDRWKHCLSGISSNYKLNQLHFDGAYVEVVIVQDNLNRDTAHLLESYLISYHNPTCNSVGKNTGCEYYEPILTGAGLDYKNIRNIVKQFTFI